MSDEQPKPKPALVHQVMVVVHPIDTTVHPTYQPGWRWGVTVGGMPVNDLDYCVGAGHATSARQASVDGETVGAAVALALQHFGIPARYVFQRMDWDPIPAEADNRPLLEFGDH